MSVTLDGDTLTLDDVLGQGVNIIFGREGTDATNPENYLSEDELAVIGEWYSENVKELLDEEAQTTLDGVDNINDAMRLNFAKDRTVQVIYKGAELGTYPWSALYGYYTIEMVMRHRRMYLSQWKRMGHCLFNTVMMMII